MRKIWYFENINLFKILCPHKYSEYEKTHTFYNYKKDDYIYFEDDQSNKVYLIDKGKVKLGYYTEDGEEVIKSVLSRGEIFGEKAVLGEETRGEFARSVDRETIICGVPSTTLKELIKDNETFSIKFYKLLGYRFKKLERRLQLLLFKDTKTRLLEFLSELAEEFGDNGESNTEDIIIRHPYTQKDIASLIGTSRPTLNSIMNELREEGIIDFKRKELRVKKDVNNHYPMQKQ